MNHYFALKKVDSIIVVISILVLIVTVTSSGDIGDGTCIIAINASDPGPQNEQQLNQIIASELSPNATNITSYTAPDAKPTPAELVDSDRYVHVTSKYCIAANQRNCDNCDKSRYACQTFNKGRMMWCCPIWLR